MFDKLLRFLALADLVGVTKAATTRGQVIHVQRGGMSGHNIKRLLRKNGVKVEHVFVFTKQNLIRIVVDDFDKAVQTLHGAGIKRGKS